MNALRLVSPPPDGLMTVEGFAARVGLPGLATEIGAGGLELDKVLASGDAVLVGRIVLALRRNAAVKAAAPVLGTNPATLPSAAQVVAAVVAANLNESKELS